MATSKTMSTKLDYDWGQTVRVVTTAPQEMRPGEVCSVCGIRELEGETLYLVEFSEGEALEIPECNLENAEEE